MFSRLKNQGSLNFQTLWYQRLRMSHLRCTHSSSCYYQTNPSDWNCISQLSHIITGSGFECKGPDCFSCWWTIYVFPYWQHWLHHWYIRWKKQLHGALIVLFQRKVKSTPTYNLGDVDVKARNYTVDSLRFTDIQECDPPCYKKNLQLAEGIGGPTTTSKYLDFLLIFPFWPESGILVISLAILVWLILDWNLIWL